MFARIHTLFLFFTFALCVSAATVDVLPRGGGGPGCTTGTQQCCNSVQDAGSPDVGLLAGLLGIALGPITGQVGINCTPITVIGTGGVNCNAQAACCTGNNYNGVLVLGCTPINLNL